MTLLAEFERPAVALARVLGLALLSGGTAAVGSFFYQSYARQRMPDGLAVLVGLGSVGVWLNTRTALSQFLGNGNVIPSVGVALINVAAFALGAFTAVGGARLGALGIAVFANSSAADLEGDVSRLVQAVGRFVTVELPETIDDIDGYEPVAPETKAAISGETFRFPRGLTVAELRERLVSRLHDDYGIGHVDVDLAVDGTVSYVAVGGRVAGIGQTLPPGTVAVAVRADPAFSASAGDLVQVWRRGTAADSESPAGDGPSDVSGAAATEDGDGSADNGRRSAERVARAEFRAAVGDVATLALSEDEAAELDPDETYRLVTLPTEQRADQEFSAQLRAADETVGAIVVAEDSPLVGLPVGGLVATVVAVRGADGAETLPERERRLAAGETLYVVARPDVLRKVESAAAGDGAAARTAADAVERS